MDQVLALVTKIAAKLGIATDATDAPPPASLFWLPSGEQIKAFAEKFGLTVDQVIGWDGTGENTAQKKLPALKGFPIAKVGDAIVRPSTAEALEYAAHGYRPDGSKWLWTRTALASARALASSVHSATSEEELDSLLPGVKFMEDEAASFAIMTGLLPGNPIPKIDLDENGFLSPIAGQTAVTTADAILYVSQAPPGYSGPGIGIG